MKRLVYSPAVNVWIKTDTGVFDLSPYVTNFQIDRRINQLSAAKVTFRNPRITDERNPLKTRFMFTEHIAADKSVRPMFHPMDPIIITLTRLKGRPIQVFTGYCDTTPYVQLLPDVATIDASCTLKRLQYTYWDPALVFVREFMKAYGWGIDPASGTAFNPTAEGREKENNDSSIGGLLYAVLTQVGGWDPKNVFIQELPSNKIIEIVTNLYKETSDEGEKAGKELREFLSKIIGASAYGEAGGGGSGASGDDSFSGSVTLIGDSITVASKKEIKDKIPNVTIFAQNSKHLDADGGDGEAIGEGADQKSGIKILQAQKNNLGEAVVIALGTNDVGTPTSSFTRSIKKAMDIIGSDKKVVWLTVKNGNDASVNKAINDSKDKYPNVTIGDWKSQAKVGSDGVHPTNQGKKEFAKVIADALGISTTGGSGSTNSTGNSRLTDGQKKFRDKLAEVTGLNSAVLTAWIIAEMNGQAAQRREAANNHNWLNIGYTGGTPLPLTNDPLWKDPVKAAVATGDFLKGKKWGAGGTIKDIIKTAGKSAAQQIEAIWTSGWEGTNSYNSGQTLTQLYNQFKTN